MTTNVDNKNSEADYSWSDSNEFWQTATPSNIARGLSAGADPDIRLDDGARPLHYAAGCGSSEMVNLLLGASADINARDDLKRTPLHVAIWMLQEETVRALLKASASTHARDADGETPLHYAASLGLVDVISLLLDAGADIEAKTTVREDTPLHIAAALGAPDSVKALVDAGADITARNALGETPLDIAERLRHLTMVEILRNANAKRKLADLHDTVEQDEGPGR